MRVWYLRRQMSSEREDASQHNCSLGLYTLINPPFVSTGSCTFCVTMRHCILLHACPQRLSQFHRLDFRHPNRLSDCCKTSRRSSSLSLAFLLYSSSFIIFAEASEHGFQLFGHAAQCLSGVIERINNQIANPPNNPIGMINQRGLIISRIQQHLLPVCTPGLDHVVEGLSCFFVC